MKILAFIAVVIIISAMWWIGVEKHRREKAYKASITEIEAEILESQSSSGVKLRKVDTKETLTIKFSLSFMMTSQKIDGLPKISKKYDCVLLSGYEIGEGSIYWLKYGGTGKVKDVIDIKLVQSKVDFVKKLAASNEIPPNINDWHVVSAHTSDIDNDGKNDCQRKYVTFANCIVGMLYYDITGEEPVLKLAFVYFGDPKTGQPITAKLWIKEAGVWKLYHLKEDDKRSIYTFKENGQIRFELR